MGALFDRVTESDREAALMRAVRAGDLTAADLEQHVPTFPLKLQIQTFSPCNAKCVMCPWPETSQTLPQGAMPEWRYRALVDQIAGQAVERTSLFLMNEPLLDRRLAGLTAHLKQAVPGTRAVIFTNGQLLTRERVLELAEAGMDEIDISINGFDRALFEQVMVGLDYDRVMANLEAIGTLHRSGALGALRIKVVALEFPGHDAALERFRERTGLEVFVKPLTNRAGAIDLDRLGIKRLLKSAAPGRFKACQRPFVKAYVLWNGDVVLCNCDWKRTTVLGNIDEQRLEDIWRGALLTSIRRNHLGRRLPRGSLCAGCDYPYMP